MAERLGDVIFEIGADETKLERGIRSAREKAKQLSGDFGRLGKKIKGSLKGADFERLGKQLTSVGKKLTLGLTAPLAGLGATATKAFIDFESSFAGVVKTVDATEKQLAVLSDGFRQMAKEIPVSVNEINRIGEAAGQLGIETENILGFTRTMADLGATTNLSSEQAATSLARLANITQMPQTSFDQLGSTIVALGNNLATTESEIVEFGLRLAGAGSQVGLSEAQILALGATLSSVGINAEAGGTAISKVMINMASAVQAGGKDLEMFANVAGKTAADFAKQFETDAAGAIQSFITGLGQMEERGGSTLGILEEMGISEQRMRDALLRAAGAGDLLNRSLEIGVRAWEENTALTKEAEVRYKTLASQLTIFWNNLKDVAIELGGSLAPALQSVLNLSKPLIESLGAAAKWFAELPQPVQTTAIVLAGVAAAIGPVALVTGHLTTAIIANMAALKAHNAALAASLVTKGKFLTVLAGKAGLVAAVGLATYGFTRWAMSASGADEAIARWRGSIQQANADAAESRTAILNLANALREQGIVVERGTMTWEEYRVALEDAWRNTKSQQNEIAQSLEKILKPAKELEGKLAALKDQYGQAEILQVYGDELKRLAALYQEHGKELPPLVQHYAALLEPTQALTESQRELADRLKDLQALPQEVAEKIAFLQREGFTAEQQLALLSGALDELKRAAQEVGIQIPESAQNLIEFGEAAQTAQEQFHKSMDKIGESIKGQAGEMGKLIKNTDSWGKSVIGLEKKLKEKLKTLAKLEKQAAEIFKATGENIQGFQTWAKGTSELRERIERLSETLNAGRERMTALKERADALKVSIEADERAFLDLQERIRKVTGKELKGFQKAADKVKDSIDKKKGALVRVQGEYDNLADVVAASEGQLEHLNETLDEHKNNLGDVGEAAKGMAKDHQEAIDEAAREAERLTRVWEETMGNVVASISENLTDALFEAKSFADGMKQTFKEMAKGLVQLLIAQLFSPLRNMMLNLGNMLGSLFSGKGTGGLNFGNLFGGGGFSLAAEAAGAAGFGAIGGGAAGAGEAAGAGGFGAIGGGAKALWSIMASNPITAAIAGAAALGFTLYRLFTQGPIEAGSKESLRDFDVGVSESSIKGFLPSVGLSKKQFEPIRKDILSSPKFLEDMLIPAAKAQGKLEELIASFSRLETSWGTFDLSGPLREAIESGNFEAFNKAWEEVFSQSDRLVAQFGPDFIEVLGGTETGLGDAGEAASKYSEEIKNLAAASGVGVEHLDIFSAAMDSQKGIVGGLQEGMAGFLGTVVGFGETLRAETDLTDAQIQSLGWEMFGDQARKLAASYEALDLELPPLLQMILDFGDAFNAFSDEVMMAAESVGVASENMDTFNTAYLSGASTLGNLQERTAALSGQMAGLMSVLLENMDAAQANEVIWALFGDNITQVAQEFITLGLEVPPFIQDMLDVGASVNAVSDEFIRMANAAKIAKEQWDAFARGREKGAQSAKGVSDQAAFLVGEIGGWTEENLPRFGDDIEAAQQLGWSEFGRQTQGIVSQLEAYRLDVPGLLRLVVDWGRDRGLLEGQNIPRPKLPTLPRASLPRSFHTPASLPRSSRTSSRSVSSGSSSLASLSASGLLPIQKAAEQLAQGQAEQVVPLLRSINQGINPDEGVETRFLPRRTVVRREEVAEIVKDILILDEGGVREVIRDIR